MEKKNILIFSTAYMPLVGGAELAIKEITDRISEYDFFMITTRFSRAHPAYERIGHIDVYRVGTGMFPLFDKLISPVWGMMKARALMRKHTFSLMWSMMVSFTSLAPVFLKMCGLHTRIPLLITLQEGDSEAHLTYRYGGLMYAMWKLALHYADRIQVISGYLKKLALKRGAHVPIDMCPNGVAFAHFSHAYPSEELEQLKGNLGKKPGDVFIITTSRLVLKNAVDDGIKSLQYLPSSVTFLILGRGPLEEDLRTLTKELHLENRVIFAGEIGHKDMPKYLQISDVYLRASLSEGLGSSFLEAMAAGLPVIATNVGGIPDFLTDRETGLFCEVRNPKSIAEKVKELLADDMLRHDIIRTGKKMIEERYTWERIGNDMKSIFSATIIHER